MIRFVRCVFSLMLLSLAVLAFPSSPQKSAVSFTGTIFAESNARVPRAGVTLCDDGGGMVQQTSANDDGEFSFQGIQAGRYILRVQATGFESAELHIDLSFASQRGVSVTLKSVRNSAEPLTIGPTISAQELALTEVSRELLVSGKKKLYGENNPQAALRDFQSVVRQAPGYYQAYYLAGIAYLSLQNSAEAEKFFRKSVDLSQNKYPDAEIALGTLLLQRGEQQGEVLLRQGLLENPHSWQGQFALGELEVRRGRLEPALAAAEQAARLAPTQPVVYRLLAVIHLRQQNYPALSADLDAYLRLDPDSPAGQRAKELRAQVERQLANSPAATVSAHK